MKAETNQNTNAVGWRRHASCVGKSELFFDETKKTKVAKAKAICASCAVVEECLNYAIKRDEHGVWGGMTANERRIYLKKIRSYLNPVL